jgi:cell wall-associated NlpC family hydrolase
MAWLGTPFHHGARINGVGADCQTFICEVYDRAGVFTAHDIPFVAAQWYLNGREELYLNYLSKYAAEYVCHPERSEGPAFAPSVAKALPEPGDIIVVKHRWVHSHGAIVVAWPQVIHCHPPGVRLSDVRTNPVLMGKQLKFFDPFQRSALSHQPSAGMAGSGVSG